MLRRRTLSVHAARILAVLLDGQGQWAHGYDIMKRAGVKSGTLYPLLIRLESRGLLEAQWQDPSEPGRPPRHAYRLTSAGVALARGNDHQIGADRPSPIPMPEELRT